MFDSVEFELDLISYMLKKSLYLKQHAERLKLLKFKDPFVSLIYKLVFTCLDDYSTVPTITELQKMAQDYMSQNEKYNILEIEAVQETITDIYSREVTDMTGLSISNYLIENEAKVLSEEFRTKSADHLIKHLAEYERKLQKLKAFSDNDEDLGLNLLSKTGIPEATKLLSDYNTVSCISTNFKLLDYQLSGGLRKGELAVIMAATNVGKTSLLLNFAANFMRQGLRVVYFALDNIEGEMIARTVGCLLQADITQTVDPALVMQEISERYGDKHANNFWFKHFAPRELNKSRLENYLDKLQAHLYELDRENGKPEEERGKIDVIVIDYMDLMLAESGASEFWISAEHLAQEIKAVLKNRDILGLTATQGGTEAMKSDTLKLYMAQGAKSKFNAPDMVFAISQDDTEKAMVPAQFRLGCLKARRSKVNYQIRFQFWKEMQLIREMEDSVIMNMSSSGATESGSKEETRTDYGLLYDNLTKNIEKTTGKEPDSSNIDDNG